MQVILLERIRKLGEMGDVVIVKDGYARNFLLPFGKALHATPANRERFERDKADLEVRNLELKSEAEQVATKLDGEGFVVIRQASDTGQLYGSVSTRDVVEQIKQKGITVERRQVLLDTPIKTLGIYPLAITLHGDVDCTISINVARSHEEAERQARGEDILAEEQEEGVEAEAVAVDVVAVFEDEELAREAAEELSEEGVAEAGAPSKAAESAAEPEAGDADAGGGEAEEKEAASKKKKSKKD